MLVLPHLDTMKIQLLLSCLPNIQYCIPNICQAGHSNHHRNWIPLGYQCSTVCMQPYCRFLQHTIQPSHNLNDRNHICKNSNNKKINQAQILFLPPILIDAFITFSIVHQVIFRTFMFIIGRHLCSMMAILCVLMMIKCSPKPSSQKSQKNYDTGYDKKDCHQTGFIAVISPSSNNSQRLLTVGCRLLHFGYLRNLWNLSCSWRFRRFMIRGCWSYGDGQWCNLWVITHIAKLQVCSTTLFHSDERTGW